MTVRLHGHIFMIVLAVCLAFSGCLIANIRALCNQNLLLKDLPNDAIEFGPVLGFAGPTELTIGLKTNDESRVTLEIDNYRFTSPEPQYHGLWSATVVPFPCKYGSYRREKA